MVFSSKADHVCNDKGHNMLIQAFGRGYDRLLPACCVVNNVRLLSLLYNLGHSQGSPCLLGSHDAATQGPNKTSVPGTRTSPKNEDTAIRVIPHGRCLQMTLWNAYACAWVTPLIRPSDHPNRLCCQW